MLQMLYMLRYPITRPRARPFHKMALVAKLQDAYPCIGLANTAIACLVASVHSLTRKDAFVA